MTATEIQRAVQTRQMSAAEATERTLAAVEARNAELNAIVTLNARARDEARAIDARIASGDAAVHRCDCPASSMMASGMPSKHSHNVPRSQVTSRPSGLRTQVVTMACSVRMIGS